MANGGFLSNITRRLKTRWCDWKAPSTQHCKGGLKTGFILWAMQWSLAGACELKMGRHYCDRFRTESPSSLARVWYRRAKDCQNIHQLKAQSTIWKALEILQRNAEINRLKRSIQDSLSRSTLSELDEGALFTMERHSKPQRPVFDTLAIPRLWSYAQH